VLNALQLPHDPDRLLAEHARDLDAALRHVAGHLIANTEVSIDDHGRLHAGKIDAVPDPPSLTDLRRRCAAMLPRVDIGEVVLGGDVLAAGVRCGVPPLPAARPAWTTWQ
jgi:hypothetical protein